MDQRILADIAAVLSTLLEAPGHTGIASYIYMGLDSDYERYQIAASVMAQAGLADVTAETITLTPLGVSKAHEVNALIGR